MILCVDCGNTLIKIGSLEDGKVMAPIIRIETSLNKTMYEYASDIDRILRLLKIPVHDAEGVVLSSVVPPLTDILSDALHLITGKRALVVGVGTKTGLKLQIDDPGTVAADLVTAAVGAKKSCPLPAIIVSMGTATTITVVNEAGAYIGGVIMPGVSISMQALARETSLLPSIEISAPKKVICTSTADSMKAGIVYGAAGAIDAVIDRFEQELGRPAASIIATGGQARTITRYCRHKILLDENLQMEGLGEIWRLNRGLTEKSIYRSEAISEGRPAQGHP